MRLCILVFRVLPFRIWCSGISILGLNILDLLFCVQRFCFCCSGFGVRISCSYVPGENARTNPNPYILYFHKILSSEQRTMIQTRICLIFTFTNASKQQYQQQFEDFLSNPNTDDVLHHSQKEKNYLVSQSEVKNFISLREISAVQSNAVVCPLLLRLEVITLTFSYSFISRTIHTLE